ncbi:nuclear transport factor 2 family protein [uncultured Modestobacter sp.]|uniref:nuclear transport factor 2 family protein n=1 Tax=uncultured Modestobacter sp. TaxID=380048 RepID=UPI002614681A|nr:nuclear transport factor 2 family protein [uncultured Modestobacter sp.]
MPVDPDSKGAASPAATRAAVLAHLDAFNAHSTDRLIAGLHEDVVWATGSDVFQGVRQLRDDVFDQGLWAMQPSLAVRTLLAEEETAAAVLREVLVVQEERREFDIAVFFTVGGGLIRTVTVFREGSADIRS